MKNNKKGFTLIEILVAIVLMLGLTVLVVINVNKVSDNKKKESLSRVKDEVKLAAEQYYDSNEYFFEGHGGVITLDTLVKEGFLNVLTNPVTGKKLNKCDHIKVSKENSEMKFEYIESDDETCLQNTQVVYSELDDPVMELECLNNFIVKDPTFYNINNYHNIFPTSSGWFNKEILNNSDNVNIMMNVLTDNMTVDSISLKDSNNNELFKNEGNNLFINSELNKDKYNIEVTGKDNNNTANCVAVLKDYEFGIDITPPSTPIPAESAFNGEDDYYRKFSCSVPQEDYLKELPDDYGNGFHWVKDEISMHDTIGVNQSQLKTFANNKSDIYCRTYKYGNGGLKIEVKDNFTSYNEYDSNNNKLPNDKNNMRMLRYILYKHNGNINDEFPNFYDETDKTGKDKNSWIPYKDTSYGDKLKYQMVKKNTSTIKKASWATYMMYYKDEAGNKSSILRVDFSPCGFCDCAAKVDKYLSNLFPSESYPFADHAEAKKECTNK